MKKWTMGILAGVVTLGIGIYVSNHLWAQQAAVYQQPTAMPQTRIAVINLGQVIKNYQKFKNFEEQLKSDSVWYQKELETRRGKLTQLQGEGGKAVDQAQREEIERQAKQLQREMQDLSDDGKAKLSKKEFDQLVQTYQEIRDAVSRYAKANNIEMVMHYNDGVGADEFSPAIFPRKLANGACQPLYVAPGMDITGYIVDMLNKNVASATPGATYQPRQ